MENSRCNLSKNQSKSCIDLPIVLAYIYYIRLINSLLELKLNSEKSYPDLIQFFYFNNAFGTDNSVWSGTTTNSAKPVTDWTIEEVADWARKVLNFDEEDLAILRKQRINGRRLLRVPTLRELKSYGLSEGSARTLWAEIEKMKKAQANSGMRLILIFFLTCGSI